MGTVRSCIFGLVALTGWFLTCSTCINLAEALSSQNQASVAFQRDLRLDEDEDFLYRLLFDGALLLVFLVQHSGMASRCWKDTLEDWGLTPVCRALYLIGASLTLQYLIRKWQPLPASPLWLLDTSDSDLLWGVFFILHIVLWIIIFGATMLMDAFEFVGIKQIYYEYHELEEPVLHKSRATQKVYNHMRHPGALCFLLVLWIHPIMTLGRFVLALSWTFYILCGHTVTETDYVYVEKQVTRKSVQYTTFELME